MGGIHQSIVAELQSLKRHWHTIARISGVPYSTVTKIAQGVHANPKIKSLERIQSALVELRQMFARVEKEQHAVERRRDDEGAAA